MREEELLLVISMEEGSIVFIFNTDEKIDDPFRIGASINIVADENQVVFRGRFDDLDHLLEGVKAAMNIADCKCSHNSVGRVNDFFAMS